VFGICSPILKFQLPRLMRRKASFHHLLYVIAAKFPVTRTQIKTSDLHSRLWWWANSRNCH
jgi:hypothetical protein